MSIKEAKIIIDEYGLNTDEETIEIVLDLINKFGSARNILIEGLKPEYKFLKKLSKLLAMSGVKKTFDTDTDAEDIANLTIAKSPLFAPLHRRLLASPSSS